MQLYGRRALVMGLGVHGGGLGVARFLASQGASVTVTDLRNAEQLHDSIAALADLPISYVLGQHRDTDFANADLVVRNPGVPRESRYLQIAQAAGAQIEMEMTLFFRLCQGPILGITGTKGKTTTTMLTGAMLREQFPHTVVAGNLRVSALEQLPRITPTTPVVLELSSFVLEGLGEAGLCPAYACVTNLSPDHLDRYGSLASYAEAKEQIFCHQTPEQVVVLNGDDPLVRQMAAHAPGQIIWFGEQLPTLPAVQCRADGIWLVTAAGSQLLVAGANIQLAGRHNWWNVAAAAALAQAFGVEVEKLQRAVQTFSGVEHRQEFVREWRGVRYINDTAATAPEAAIAALHSFDRPIILIAGGADKNLPFDDLAAAMLAHSKAIVLLNGSATAKLQTALAAQQRQGSPPISGPFEQFADAIYHASQLAEPGEIVLLSPGCASFGMFRNEFHRGEEFRRIVHELQ
jgi:UDP-N-acetylmuramoylalanine--D-glutamate ligase